MKAPLNLADFIKQNQKLKRFQNKIYLLKIIIILILIIFILFNTVILKF